MGNHNYFAFIVKSCSVTRDLSVMETLSPSIAGASYRLSSEWGSPCTEQVRVNFERGLSRAGHTCKNSLQKLQVAKNGHLPRPMAYIIISERLPRPLSRQDKKKHVTHHIVGLLFSIISSETRTV